MGFVTPAQRYDVVTVGDVATDVFIQLPEEAVTVRHDDSGAWLEIPLGAKVPYQQSVTVAAGGSAANVAVGLARLGMRVALASFLAHDEIGRDLLSALHTEEVDTRLVHIDSPAHTNRNFVLSYKGERTIFVWHEEFDYHWPHLRPSEVPAWLYVTSLAAGGRPYEEQIADWLEETPGVRLILQPGTRQVGDGAERLRRLLNRAELLVCDQSRAESLVGRKVSDVMALLSDLHKLGPRQLVLADETGGGFASDGETCYRVEACPGDGPIVDRTGATDAFAAAVAAGLVHGLPLKEALCWGPPNARRVSAHIGSQSGLLHEEEMAGELKTLGESLAVSTTRGSGPS